MVGGLTLAAYFLGFTRLAAPGMEGAVANTMAFSTLTLSQLFHAFNVRRRGPLHLRPGVLSNPAMNRAFLAGLVLQLSVLLIPPLQGVFSVVPMDFASGSRCWCWPPPRCPSASAPRPLPAALRPGTRGGAGLRHRPPPAESRTEVGRERQEGAARCAAPTGNLPSTPGGSRTAPTADTGAIPFYKGRTPAGPSRVLCGSRAYPHPPRIRSAPSPC